MIIIIIVIVLILDIIILIYGQPGSFFRDPNDKCLLLFKQQKKMSVSRKIQDSNLVHFPVDT